MWMIVIRARGACDITCVVIAIVAAITVVVILVIDAVFVFPCVS